MEEINYSLSERFLQLLENENDFVPTIDLNAYPDFDENQLDSNEEMLVATPEEVLAEGNEQEEVLAEENEQEEVLAEENEFTEEFLNEGPKTSLVYANREDLFQAYLAHAKHKGFSIATRTIRCKKYLMICCDRGRKSEVKKCTKRINCLARLNAIKQDDGSWKVSTVCSSHNHDLDPQFTIFMPGHRSLSINMRRQLEANDIAGLRPCKNIRLAEVQSEGPLNLGCLAKDCLNYIEERRMLRLGDGDAEAIRGLFMRLQRQDKSFFNLMDIGDDSKLKNVMWIHPRSIATYEEFHDVLTFDTTYLVNQYKMPFGTMISVNHHNQSILLGYALMSHETLNSFKWFFKFWLEAMGGIVPRAILTDQCPSIRAAVEEVFPDSIHRFCLWHIVKKTGEKFKGMKSFSQVVLDFNAVVYNSCSIREFEHDWDEFIEKHALYDNEWLRDLYKERQYWSMVYINHTFWAGMVSSQRSESMHAFFDSYIHSRSTLKQFVEQYEIAITAKIMKELQADYTSKCRPLQCASKFKWEEQFTSVYANSIVKLFQDEIKNMWNCNVSAFEDVGGILKYEVTESRTINETFSKEFNFTVEYRLTGEYLNCDCRKFESKGILCSHILKVLQYKKIDSVNERYILPRWRKDLYRRHSRIIFTGGYPHMTAEYKRHQWVEREFQECSDIAYYSDQKMDFLYSWIKEGKAKLKNMDPLYTAEDPSSDKNTDENLELNAILDPDIARSKGRPKMLRFKSILEGKKSVAEKKRKAMERKQKAVEKQKDGDKGVSTSRGRSRGRGLSEKDPPNVEDTHVGYNV